MREEAAPPIQVGFLEGGLEGLGVWELLRAKEDRRRSLRIPRWERLGVQPWYPPTPSHLASWYSACLSFSSSSTSMPSPRPLRWKSVKWTEGLARGYLKIPRVECRGSPGRRSVSPPRPCSPHREHAANPQLVL